MPPKGPEARPGSAAASRKPPQQQPVSQARQAQQTPVPSRQVDAVSVGSADDEDVELPTVDQKYLSDKKFEEFNISPNSKRALAEVLKYERCSLVQAAAIPVCLGAEDVIAKAKTGTGKTLAFIIPTIEKVLARRAPAGKVSALVLSPTRELARQIQTETHKMLTFHPGLHSMVVYGGVDVKKHLRALKQRMPDILIATPGRCWDIMTQDHDPSVRTFLDSVCVLVLDEADNLLDMGFRPQITKILSALPPTTRRHTYLFSATFPNDVKSLADVALKKQHSHVDAVGEDVDTHVHVDASALVVSKAELPLQLLLLLAQHMQAEPDYKVIVFLPTAHLTALYAEAFSSAGLGGVVEIHSRKSQPQRDRASAQFRSESRLVMFSSDVSARGVDYPNVTFVVQVGAPANREQYIHRAGRTGRAGRSGQCTLLLSDFERPFLDRLRDLPMTHLKPLAPPPGGLPLGGALSPALARDPAGTLERAVSNIEYSNRARAYQSFLGYYKSHEVIKSRPEQVVATANEYAAAVLACPTPPGLLAKTVGKMGLKGVPGLVIVKEGQLGMAPPGTNPGGGQGAGARGGSARGGPAGGNGGGGPGGRNAPPTPQQQLQQGMGGRGPAQQQLGGRGGPAGADPMLPPGLAPRGGGQPVGPAGNRAGGRDPAGEAATAAAAALGRGLQRAPAEAAASMPAAAAAAASAAAALGDAGPAGGAAGGGGGAGGPGSSRKRNRGGSGRRPRSAAGGGDAGGGGNGSSGAGGTAAAAAAAGALTGLGPGARGGGGRGPRGPPPGAPRPPGRA